MNTIKRNFLLGLLVLINFLFVSQLGAQKLCVDQGAEVISGVQDGYRYELWNQYSQGHACMTLGAGALFSGEWDGIENYLARRGLAYDQTKPHQAIGHFAAQYNCDYQPSTASGNSYLSVYGWSVNPLIEYYIIEDWCRWIPSMDKNAIFKGTFEVDGSLYDIYENTRINQPSIEGNTTFQQYFSIRRDKRQAGKINISAHFDKWEELGMKMGLMHEVSIVVEGYKSSGSFCFNELKVIVEE